MSNPTPPSDPRQVQTFSMPEPPPAPPEESAGRGGRGSTANFWIITIFVVALVGVVGFWKLYLQPKQQEAAAAAAAEAANVRPWDVRGEEALRLTIEGSAGSALALALAEVLTPGITAANLDGLAVTRAGPNVTALFTISWKDAAGAPTGAQVRWTFSETDAVEAALVVPAGSPPLPAEQSAGLARVLNQQTLPLVRRNTRDK